VNAVYPKQYTNPDTDLKMLNIFLSRDLLGLFNISGCAESVNMFSEKVYHKNSNVKTSKGRPKYRYQPYNCSNYQKFVEFNLIYFNLIPDI
jgi:hypothetical protein